MNDICEKKVEWLKTTENGINVWPACHAYDYDNAPRGNHCFWCGKHREDGQTAPTDKFAELRPDPWWE